MPDQIDIVLSAIDDTAPATESVIRNFDALGAAAQQTNIQIEASVAGGGIASLIGSLFSLPGLLAAGGIAAFVFRDEIASVATSIGTSVLQTVDEIMQGTFDWAGLFQGVVRGIVTGFAVVEYTFMNWNDVVGLVFTTVAHRVVEFANTVQYYFTEVIPAWLGWFGQNWADVFTTIYDYVATVIGNMHENLVRFFTAVIEWLSGNGFNFEWKGLTEGFESSIKELPEILARQEGEIEKALRIQAESLGQAVGEGMAENIDKRVKQIPDLLAGAQDLLGSAAAGGKDLFNRIFNPDKASKQQIQLSLPSLENDRFTTGQQAAAEERNAIMMAELSAQSKQQTTLMQQVADLLRGKIPSDIQKGVKAGIEAAKTGSAGIPLKP